MHLFPHLATSSLSTVVVSTAILSAYPIQIQTTLDVVNSDVTDIVSSSLPCDGRQIFTALACRGDGMEAEERQLYDIVNSYRQQNDLPIIPFSPALSQVANRHVIDLDQNLNKLSHDWSDCDLGWSCMWKAPQRLGTAYPGNGYENAYRSGSSIVEAQSVLQTWQSSSAHNAVLLNQGIWNDKEWNAMGIGIHKGYAVLWVGEEVDPTSSTR